MGEQHGSTTTADMPVGPVLDEIKRIVRIVDREAPGGGYAVAALRAVRDSVAPGLTTAVWREWAGGSRLAREIEEQERREQLGRQREQREREIRSILDAAGVQRRDTRFPALRRLFDAHGYNIEGGPGGSDHEYMASWERSGGHQVQELVAAALAELQGGVQPTLPGVVEEPERTCECSACSDQHCQGECEQCEDHDCEQCYHGHTVYGCCGYCEDCDHHVQRDGYHRCSHCEHCSECEHYCD